MTENMLRWLIIWGMEKLVAKTENKWDDELFQRMKKELEK
jgi:hypothetical protein